MTNFGIVGNREGWTYKEVKQRLQHHNITFNDTIISGGANGVDTYALQFAREIGAKMIIIYPNPLLSSPIRYYKRNFAIARCCDELIAFDKKEYSGTLNTVNFAEKLNKKVTIYKR